MSTMPGVERSDAELVTAAVSGDRAAFAALYDRHVDRVFSACVRLLDDRHDAADCAGDVFLIAAERLHQLRDPERLRPWLFAIARHEAFRRTRRRRREIPTDDMFDQPAPTDDEPDVDPDSARRLIDEASDGLDERDRLALALSLDGSLDGEDLAAALGTTTATAHVVVHRMRERLGTAIGALLVARHGRADCGELATILAGWDGRFDVLTRKRVGRHVAGCDTCEKRARRMPAALLSSGAALAAPADIRDRVLGDVKLVSHTGRPWSSDGFPPPDPRVVRRSRRAAWALVLVALLASAVAVAVAAIGPPDAGVERVLIRTPSTAPTTSPGSTAAPTTTPAALDTAAPTTTSPGTTTTPSSTAAPSGPAITVTPTSLDLATTDTSGTFSVASTGGQVASIVVGSAAAWLTVDPPTAQITPRSTATFTVTLRRDLAPEGTPSASVTVTLAGGSAVTVTVSATVGTGPVIDVVTAPTQLAIVNGCPVTVIATDPAGVGAVAVEYTTPNGTSTAPLTNSTGSTWSARIDVGGPPRDVTWRVVARDQLGNETRSADRVTPAGSFCQ